MELKNAKKYILLKITTLFKTNKYDEKIFETFKKYIDCFYKESLECDPQIFEGVLIYVTTLILPVQTRIDMIKHICSYGTKYQNSYYLECADVLNNLYIKKFNSEIMELLKNNNFDFSWCYNGYGDSDKIDRYANILTDSSIWL